MSDILSDVVIGYGQNQRVATRIQQLNKDPEVKNAAKLQEGNKPGGGDMFTTCVVHSAFY